MTVPESLVNDTFARELGRALLASDSLTVVAVDDDGRIRGWSDGAEAMFGWFHLGRPLPVARAT